MHPSAAKKRRKTGFFLRLMSTAISPIQIFWQRYCRQPTGRQDFFRWKVEYGNRELTDIIREKSGIDFGILRNLVPLERGPSGRISRLLIEGTQAKIVIGKELEIRRWLSKSHLYSSAFIVRCLNDSNGLPTRFIFYGAGWGHGVGLCQIGAAAMAARGLTWQEILSHYFNGAKLVKRY